MRSSDFDDGSCENGCCGDGDDWTDSGTAENGRMRSVAFGLIRILVMV